MPASRDDQPYLVNEQYRDSSNLDARIALHRRFSTSTESWYHWLFDRIEAGPHARIVEIGAGTGEVWKENSGRIPLGWQITLTDLSPGMLDDARENLKDVRHPVAYAVADAQQLSFPDGYFDVVIANHVLFHVPDRDMAIGEIRRVLRPGGRLYASTLGAQNMPELNQPFRAINPEMDFGQTLSFNLENGVEQLHMQFEHVRVEPFEDSLEVTEAAPLIAYVESSWRWKRLTVEQRGLFASWVGNELAAHGSIHISKSQGALIAW